MTHKYPIGTKVKHFDRPNTTGTIVGHTTLSEVVDGDCEEHEENYPWYQIDWNEDQFEGQESEGSILPL